MKFGNGKLSIADCLTDEQCEYVVWRIKTKGDLDDVLFVYEKLKFAKMAEWLLFLELKIFTECEWNKYATRISENMEQINPAYYMKLSNHVEKLVD